MAVVRPSPGGRRARKIILVWLDFLDVSFHPKRDIQSKISISRGKTFLSVSFLVGNIGIMLKLASTIDECFVHTKFVTWPLALEAEIIQAPKRMKPRGMGKSTNLVTHISSRCFQFLISGILGDTVNDSIDR